MRARQFGNAVQCVSRWIEIFHVLAVDVNFKLAGQIRQPFRDDSFAAVPPVEKGRNNCQADFRLEGVHVVILVDG